MTGEGHIPYDLLWLLHELNAIKNQGNLRNYCTKQRNKKKFRHPCSIFSHKLQLCFCSKNRLSLSHSDDQYNAYALFIAHIFPHVTGHRQTLNSGQSAHFSLL